MVKLITFDEAIRDSAECSKRNLLLGNGFSIACKPEIFHYDSLYNQADFSLLPKVKAAFEALRTQDFEIVIRSLERGALLMPIYGGSKDAAREMKENAAALKELLISTVAGNHPERPGDISDTRYWACRKFLAHFLAGEFRGRIYTLNYDLLLYWTLMHDDNPFAGNPADITSIDGFGTDEDDPDAEYVVWKAETTANKQCVHYLHGALHLYDAGAELNKYTWNRSGVPLIDQARMAMNGGMYPVFVSEGESRGKLAKIRHTAYLQHSLKSFNAVMDQKNQALFIYGHSLAKNDDHILTRIGRGKCPKVYISLHGDPDSKANKQIISRAEDLAAMRQPRYPMALAFYDSSTAKVWGGP